MRNRFPDSGGPDSPPIATDYSPGVVSFDIAMGRGFSIFEAPGGIENARCARVIAISPSGYQLAVSEWDHSITVYETATGKIRHRLRGHRNMIFQLSFARDGRRLISGSLDGTGLVWDVSPSGLARSISGQRPILQKSFADLVSEDNPTAAQAMCELFSVPAAAIECMKEKLHGVAVSDSEMKVLIERLAAGDYGEREAATQKLDSLGLVAVSYVRQTISTIESAEARRRMTNFLSRHDKHGLLSGARLQERRAVELLEMISTPDARDLLRKLAAGGASSLAKESADALTRLEGTSK